MIESLSLCVCLVALFTVLGTANAAKTQIAHGEFVRSAGGHFDRRLGRIKGQRRRLQANIKVDTQLQYV